MSLFERDRSAERLPVTVLTGFLGSGKTTLLGRLLAHPDLANTAVIINEFGEIGLDHLLIERVEGEMVVMKSGCVCCALRSDLEATLRDLHWRRREGEIPAFERVMVETTGLADPAPIAQTLLNNPLVAGLFRLEAVATTVDALHGAAQLDRHRESVRQAAIADRLVLTKTDLADAATVQAIEERLRRLNPRAPVHRVVQGEIAPDRLFDGGWRAPASWLGAAEEDHAHGHDHGHQHEHDHAGGHAHDGIVSLSLTAERPLDWERVHRWMAELRGHHGDKLLRVKGILDIAGEDGPVVVHGVHHVFHSPIRLAAWPDADRRSRLVFIVEDLDPALLRAGWPDLAA